MATHLTRVRQPARNFGVPSPLPPPSAAPSKAVATLRPAAAAAAACIPARSRFPEQFPLRPGDPSQGIPE